MAKSRIQKETAVQQLAEQMSKKGVVFFNYSGLTVADMEELRGKLREQQASMTVTKRTFLKRALREKGLTIEDNFAAGPVAMVAADDEVMPAKIVDTFRKKLEQIEFYGGILEEKLIDVDQVNVLAALPTKPELYAKIVGSIKAPMSGLVNVLAGNMRGLVQVLNAIKEKKA